MGNAAYFNNSATALPTTLLGQDCVLTDAGLPAGGTDRTFVWWAKYTGPVGTGGTLTNSAIAWMYGVSTGSPLYANMWTGMTKAGGWMFSEYGGGMNAGAGTADNGWHFSAATLAWSSQGLGGILEDTTLIGTHTGTVNTVLANGIGPGGSNVIAIGGVYGTPT